MDENRGIVMTNDQRALRERMPWERHKKLHNTQPIITPFDHWHVRRVEAFNGRFPGRRFAEPGPPEVNENLILMDCQGELKP